MGPFPAPDAPLRSWQAAAMIAPRHHLAIDQKILARPTHRVLAWAQALAVLTALVGCTGGFECECFFADRAVTLTVVDAVTQRGIDDFFVELIVNEEPRGEPAECNARFREGNTCSFGDEPGRYHVIVRAPGFETREAVARVAEEANSELCCNALLSAKSIELQLTPAP
jgi:hypothetical protein